LTSLENIKRIILDCIETLYTHDEFLFQQNEGRGVCERCLTFRFAHYLQLACPDYFVDCDFNACCENGVARRGKQITNPDGTETGRYVDIIIHKRTMRSGNDFICFEVKKASNRHHDLYMQDQRKLRQLTNEYGYSYGFHLILGSTRQETRCTIFDRNGEQIAWEVGCGE
jgi:hypothetical protein